MLRTRRELASRAGGPSDSGALSRRSVELTSSACIVRSDRLPPENEAKESSEMDRIFEKRSPLLLLVGCAVLCWASVATASPERTALTSAASTSQLARTHAPQNRQLAGTGGAGSKPPPRGSSAELQGGSSADRYGGSSADRGGIAGPQDRRHGKFKSDDQIEEEQREESEVRRARRRAEEAQEQGSN